MRHILQHKRHVVFFVFSICVCLLYSSIAKAESTPYINLGEYAHGLKIPVKTKFKTRLFAPNTISTVKIYPDFVKREMHVIAKKKNKKVVDFFVFDMQGTLLFNKRMKANDHAKIQNLHRGKYLYRVFAGDEETTAGEIEFR